MTQSTIVASAPGKLFLVGEYAVLDGAPAILTAVDRRATVTLQTADGPNWWLYAPGLGAESFALGVDGQMPANADATTARDLRVFDACRAECAATFGVVPRALAITIDTRAFRGDGHKLGLGSSAAVAAALCHALARAAGTELDRETLLTTAVAAHRRAQHGAGSGGDVAAAVYGGLIRYQATADTRVTPLRWPADLAGLAVVTGTGASTPELVGRVQRFAQLHPKPYARLMEPLYRLAGEAAASLASSEAFIALCRDYFAALSALDARVRAGIVTGRHRALAALAETHDAVFKSCGAGGGDVGLVFTRVDAKTIDPAPWLDDSHDRIVALDMNARGATLMVEGPSSAP